jgi:hypothetical protein
MCLLLLCGALQSEIEKVQKRREEREAEKARMEEELVRKGRGCVWRGMAAVQVHLHLHPGAGGGEGAGNGGLRAGARWGPRLSTMH